MFAGNERAQLQSKLNFFKIIMFYSSVFSIYVRSIPYLHNTWFIQDETSRCFYLSPNPSHPTRT